MDNRRIKVWADRNIDFLDLPEDWDAMSNSAQEAWRADAASTHLENNIDYGAELTTTADEDYEAGYYSDTSGA